VLTESTARYRMRLDAKGAAAISLAIGCGMLCPARD
jgi:hypothetical protein